LQRLDGDGVMRRICHADDSSINTSGGGGGVGGASTPARDARYDRGKTTPTPDRPSDKQVAIVMRRANNLHCPPAGRPPGAVSSLL